MYFLGPGNVFSVAPATLDFRFLDKKGILRYSPSPDKELHRGPDFALLRPGAHYALEMLK
jgi:hypothetical protein